MSQGSWRFDEREVKPQSSSVRVQQPAKKAVARGDDDEFDFGAPPSKGQTAAPVSSATQQVKAEDLWNPLKFSLHRVFLKRSAGQSFGFDVETVSNGVVKVMEVAGKGVAESGGMEKGTYVLSIDGKKITTDAAVKAIEKSGSRKIQVAVVKQRPMSWQPNVFPMPASVQRQPGHEYLLLRLDPTDNVKVGAGIAQKDSGGIYITKLSDNSATKNAGARVDDRILAVDEQPIPNLDTCKTMVVKSAGNPFDMMLERAPPPPPPPPPPAPKPPPPRDPNAGDPAHGVPVAVPQDVSEFLDSRAKKTMESVRLATKRKKGKSPSMRGKSPAPSVKVDKKIKQTKLKGKQRDQPDSSKQQ